MNKILIDLSPRTIVDALRQNFYDVCWELRDQWKGAVFEETEKQRRWWTSMPAAFIFNAAVSKQPPAGMKQYISKKQWNFFSQSDERRSVGGLPPGWKRVVGGVNSKRMDFAGKLALPAWQSI
jgi:hypothetical protein